MLKYIYAVLCCFFSLSSFCLLLYSGDQEHPWNALWYALLAIMSCALGVWFGNLAERAGI